MKKLLATTALAALISGPALAQSETKPDATYPTANQTDATQTEANDAGADANAEMKETAGEPGATATRTDEMVYGDPAFQTGEMSLRASNLLGQTLYTREGGIAADEADGWAMSNDITDPQDDWDNMGEIEDVLISQQGQVESVIAGVGGFLDMGDDSVRISMDDLSFVPDGDAEGEYFIVYKGDANVLRDAGAYDPDTVMGEGYRSARSETGLMETNLADYTAEDLEGASVYGSNDERVGEIGKLILGEGDKITQAVIDVGGFLGIGEKPVAVNFNDIRLMRTENDETPRAYINMTQEQLENLPEYED